WNNYLQRDGAGDGTEVPLMTESLNPIYSETMQSAIAMASKIETLRGSVKQYEASLQAINAQMNQLEVQIDELKQEVDRRTKTIEGAEAALKLLREDYLA